MAGVLPEISEVCVLGVLESRVLLVLVSAGFEPVEPVAPTVFDPSRSLSIRGSALFAMFVWRFISSYSSNLECGEQTSCGPAVVLEVPVVVPVVAPVVDPVNELFSGEAT